MLHDITAPVPNRADEDCRPELAAILAAIANFRTTLRSACECCINSCERIGIGAACHQEVETLAEFLFPDIAGQIKKGIIGKNYGIAGLFWVGKQHRHARVFGGNDERTKVLPKALDPSFGSLLAFGLGYYFRNVLALPGYLAGRNQPITLYTVHDVYDVS
jgi:hypothetical protein